MGSPATGSTPSTADSGEHRLALDLRAVPAHIWCMTETQSLPTDLMNTLYVSAGAAKLLRHIGPRVVITGSRSTSGYGVEVARLMVAQLAGTNAVVLTGGAYGIDAAVMEACFSLDLPHVAVLAHGLDRFYPAGNAERLSRTPRVSQYGEGTAPTRARFLERLQLLAHLATHIVVVESGVRGGSIGLAHAASGTLTRVGAVPGPVTSAQSAGSNALLAAGADLVTPATFRGWVEA